MKKRFFGLMAILTTILLTPVLASAETVAYSDDCVSFEYDNEMYGTIKKSVEDDGIRRYNAESYEGNFETYIHVLNIDEYVNMLSNSENPPTRENYKEVILNDEDSSAYKKSFTNNDKDEVKLISTWDGCITYQKIIAESDTTFLLVGYKAVNDNESKVGKGFRTIYDSVSPSEEFLSIDFSTIDTAERIEIIHGKKEAYDYGKDIELDKDTKKFIGRVVQELMQYNIDTTINLNIGNGGEDMMKMEQVDNIVVVDGSFSHNFSDYEFKVEFSYEMENEWSGTYDTIYININNLDLYGSYKELEK